MQQLYLTGLHASQLAERLFQAMNVRPAGYRLLPFCVGDAPRGDALHLLLPTPPAGNDVPCRIRLSEGRAVLVPQALEEFAAPALRSAACIHTPMLMDELTADMLACPQFREAVRQCLMSDHAVVVVAAPDASDALRALTPATHQLWMHVPEDGEARAELLSALVEEAAMRF